MICMMSTCWSIRNKSSQSMSWSSWSKLSQLTLCSFYFHTQFTWLSSCTSNAYICQQTGIDLTGLGSDSWANWVWFVSYITYSNWKRIASSWIFRMICAENSICPSAVVLQDLGTSVISMSVFLLTKRLGRSTVAKLMRTWASRLFRIISEKRKFKGQHLCLKCSPLQHWKRLRTDVHNRQCPSFNVITEFWNEANVQSYAARPSVTWTTCVSCSYVIEHS